MSAVISIEIDENIDIAQNCLINYDNSCVGQLMYESNLCSYNRFFKKFMLQNIPCLIKNASDNWECTKKWVLEDKINYELFIKEYGELFAPVANCDIINFNSQCKTDMKVGDFMKYLSGAKEQLLYLKDWHLRRTRPHDFFYEVPIMFSSDWLNEYAQDKDEDDFMFVYIGPKNSWTPLHVDVYSSYSWSVNVTGRKKWLFFPPGEENKLKDNLGNLPLNFEPNCYKGINFFEIIQEKGDAIFVPSGWHHQVTNLNDTISINHNWINGCNIGIVWAAIQESLQSVEREIEEFHDTPEYVNQCQLILKSLFGLNYESFIIFLNHIAEKRLAQLQGKQTLLFNKYILGINHVKFDLAAILQVMNNITNDKAFFDKYLINHLKNNFVCIKNIIAENLL